jgi:CRISPR-associated protein Csy1
MSTTDPQRVAALRAVVADFLKKRLNDKLDDKLKKIKDDDEAALAVRAELHHAFNAENWLTSAAKRIKQIQLVTHVLKATHPDPKIDQATNLYVPPRNLAAHALVGSHVLGESFDDDVTGNAAVLDVYGFLTQEFQGATLLELVRVKDGDLAQALSSQPEQAAAWMQTFSGIELPRCAKPTSHTLAKQLYWLTGSDPHDDASYHLLAPLYASSMAHRVYQTVQDDRFSDDAKTAREAKKTGVFSERPVREYPQLAVQQLGGTKPHNISQLNSQRRGNNLLLASLPPVWRSLDLKPLLNTESMFARYSRRPEVRPLLKALLAFLKSEPARNAGTRARRTEWVNALIDEFLQLSAELRSLPPGWSQTTDCHLGSAQKHWLDPYGVAQASTASGQALPTDTAEQISAAFANWLNAELRDPLPMGDPEFMEWRQQMHEQIKAYEREGRDAD